MAVNLNQNKRIVGIKQVKRALNSDKVQTVYIAKDAEQRVTSPVEILCKEKQIDIVYIDTMKELGEICNIDVNAAVAALLK